MTKTPAIRTIATSRFGDVEVQEDRIISFLEPILGFEGMSAFILLDHAEESPFKWLQSGENPDLAFVVTNPRFFGIDYTFTLPESTAERLQISAPEDVLVLTIVNIPQGNPEQMTANMLGPLIVNQQNLNAMQVVLNNTEYTTKTLLLEEKALSEKTGVASTSDQER